MIVLLIAIAGLLAAIVTFGLGVLIWLVICCYALASRDILLDGGDD